MLFTTGCSRIKSIVVVVAALLALPACTVEAGDEAAHAIAEKFALETTSHDAEDLESSEADTQVAEAESLADAQRTADEADMLARARAEAEARRKADEERRIAEQAARKQAERAAEARRLAEDRKRAEAARAAAERVEAERRAEAQREADEAEMLARARAEAEERRRAEQRRLQAAEAEQQRLRALEAAEQERRRAARLAEEDRQRAVSQAKRLAEIAAQEEARKAEEARRIAEMEQRKTAEYWRRFEEEQRRNAAKAKRGAEAVAPDVERRAAEARRQAVLRQLEEEGRRKAEQAEAIAAIATAEEARKSQPDRDSRQGSDRLEPSKVRRDQRERAYPSPHALGGPPPRKAAHTDRGPAHSSRVTVLLVMEPGERGIRRFNETADPILCVGTRCYISDGPDQPARAMTRRGAFGPAVALGTRAGRCRNSLTCVFRAVDLERAPAVVQPVDLRILRHDRREPRAAAADPTCRIEGERLTCSRPVIASDYKLWIVPEGVAERAGSFALALAVRAGLPDESSLTHARFGRR